jgi:hypothetical protein
MGECAARRSARQESLATSGCLSAAIGLWTVVLAQAFGALVRRPSDPYPELLLARTCARAGRGRISIAPAQRSAGCAPSSRSRPGRPVPVIDGVLLSRMEIGTWQTRVGRFDVLRGIPNTATTRAEFEELSARAITSEASGRAVRVATNAIEALNRQLRKAIKTKGSFPNEDAARKLVYLALQNAVPQGTRTRNWTTALLAFKIHFGDRVPDTAN